MSEELKIIQNEDGTFSEDDDTFDIAIHCQSEEEQNEVLAKLNAQEPCGDCISRQAVLESIDVKAWEFCDYLIRNGRNDEQKPVSHFADNLRECVGEDLPPVTPQPNKWIPVETELPEVGIDVLMCDMEGTIYLSHRSSYGSYFDEWGNKIKNIKAWMPLPEKPCMQEVGE